MDKNSNNASWSEFNRMVDRYTAELQKFRKENTSRTSPPQPPQKVQPEAPKRNENSTPPPKTPPTPTTSQPSATITPSVKQDTVEKDCPLPTTKVEQVYTTSLGTPITGDNDSITIGPDGPMLLQDMHFLDKIAHFDRERIPERVVHAKGAGAFGTFKCYSCMSKYTCAEFLDTAGKETPVFVRFSTVIGSKGSADTARDPRGFATKFYTKQGNYDITGNNIPVFFIRDAIKFPDIIHSLKPSPVTNLTDPERFWDFISLTPESTHMIMWLYSDNGTIGSYRHIDGFGVNTYVWVNSKGERRFIKYHWKTKQGLRTLDRHEAIRLAGVNPNQSTEDLHKAIAMGNFPKWELCVQMMNPQQAEDLSYDPLDDTKVWDETQFPLIPVGIMTLNRNPENFFAQVEQAAFCPANLIPGVELSADKMLQGRAFSYSDTQRYRLGVNFMQLPINRPIAPVNNHQQDGAATYTYSTSDVNYSPNSLANNQPAVSYPCSIPQPYICGNIGRLPIDAEDDFIQAGEKYHSYSELEQDHLIDNIAVELYKVREDIKCRVVANLSRADKSLGEKLVCLMDMYTKKAQEKQRS